MSGEDVGQSWPLGFSSQVISLRVVYQPFISDYSEGDFYAELLGAGGIKDKKVLRAVPLTSK